MAVVPGGISLAVHVSFKVACTSGQIFEKNMKRYPIFSVQIVKAAESVSLRLLYVDISLL